MNIKAAVLEILFNSNSAQIRSDIKGVNQEVEKTGKEGSKNVAGFDKTFGSLAVTAGIVMEAMTAVDVAIKKTIDFGKEGAAIERLQEAGYSLAASMDSNMRDIVASVQAASLGTVSEMDIIASANRAMMLGLGADADQLGNLMQIAAFRARAMGISTTQAFNDIVTGIGRNSPLILDNLGIIIDSNTVYEKYAQKIGVAKDKLEEHQKTQALLNDVLETGNEMITAQGGLVMDNAGQWERLDASFKDYMDSVKAGASGPLAELAKMLNVHVSEWTMDKKFRDLKKELKDAGVEVQGFTADWKANQNTMGWTADQEEALRIIEAMINAAEEVKPTPFFEMIMGGYEEAGIGLEAMNTEYAIMDGTLQAMDAHWQSLSEVDEMISSHVALRESYASLRDLQNELTLAQQNWGEGFAGDVVGQLRQGGIEGEVFKEALGAIDTQFGTNYLMQENMKEGIGGLIDEYKRTGDIETFKTGMQDLQDTFMPLSEDVLRVTGEIETLQNKINALAKNYHLHIIMTTSGGSTLESGGGGGGGGDGWTEQTDAFGTSFTVPAGYPADSFEWRSMLTSGEHVTVSAAGAPAGGGSAQSVINISEGAIRIETQGTGEIDVRALAERIVDEIQVRG